ncbi:MAG: ABC transporter permease [Chitinophagales bacterium]|nr:ABC transporter permease [Chitinophagales bacterium]
MKTIFTIASRYLFSKKSTNAINIISYVSMAGMGIGAAVLVVLLSVFNGFESLVVTLQSSFYPDIEIKQTTGKFFKQENELFAKLNEIPEVESVCLVLEENAYVNYNGKSTIAKARGYDTNFNKVNSIEDYMVKGDAILTEKNQDYAVLGAGVYTTLEANNNQPITIAIPKKGKNTTIIASQLFKTAQIFPSGVFAIQTEFDNSYILTSLPFMQNLSDNKGKISSIEVKLKSTANEKTAVKNMQKLLGNTYTVTTRVEQNKSLYKAMQAEKYAMVAILFLVLLIISFTIVGALSMLSLEKTLDISILKAMGAGKNKIFKIFMGVGIMGSLIGAGVGAFLGVLIIGAQQLFGIVKLGGAEGGFVIDAYPVKLLFTDVLLSFALIIIISIIASWLPAKRAANAALQFQKY